MILKPLTLPAMETQSYNYSTLNANFRGGGWSQREDIPLPLYDTLTIIIYRIYLIKHPP